MSFLFEDVWLRCQKCSPLVQQLSSSGGGLNAEKVQHSALECMHFHMISPQLTVFVLLCM